MKSVDIVVFDASQSGGIEQFAIRLQEMLQDNGYKARIVTLFYGADISLKPDHIVSIRNHAFRNEGIFQIIKAVWRLKTLTQSSVIIHTYNNIFILSALFDVMSLNRAVYTEHSAYDAVRPHVRFLLKLLLRLCSAIVCQTHYSFERYSRNKLDLVYKIPPSYTDAHKLKTVKDCGKVHIAFVGRLENEKGILDFIELSKLLMRLNPKITTHIFGVGSLRDVVLNFCNSDEFNGRTTYYGYRERWYEHVPQLNFLFILSQSESFSIVGIEALSIGAGLVVYDDLAGPRDYATPINSIAIKRRDLDSFVVDLQINMIELLNEREFKNNCIRSVENYSKIKFQDDWLEVIENV